MWHARLWLALAPAASFANLGCALDDRSLGTAPESAAGSSAVGVDDAARLGLGVACSRDQQCLSGACVDGVCCDAVCDSLCAACDVPGSMGRCTAIEPGCETAAVEGPAIDAPAIDVPGAAAPGADAACNDGVTIDCGTLQGAIGACAAAVARCSGGSWLRQACEPTSVELCDPLFEDENCNGQSNERAPCETFSAISGGANYVCGVSTGGGVLCWGSNEDGQLGDGTLINREVPTPVVGLGSDIRSVVTSWSTSCAVSNAGNISCWGEELHWVRGGTSGASLIPVPATLFPPVLALAIVGSQACAILADQTLVCSATDPTAPGAGVVGVTPIAGFEGIQAISGGDAGACGLIVNGSVRCWSGAPDAAPVTVPGLTGALQISGDNAAACAVVMDGTVRCWGASGYTALGAAADPGPMGLVTVPGVSGAVAAFTNSSGGCALSNAGAVQCWGGGAAAGVERFAAVQNADLLALSLLGDRVFVRLSSGEVFGFSPVDSRPNPMDGNPNADDNGPFRLMGP